MNFLQVLRELKCTHNAPNLFAIATALTNAYNEPHRSWHGTAHIAGLIDRIAGSSADCPSALTEHDHELLILSILFHDYVYDPRSKTNEEDSNAKFLEFFGSFLPQDDLAKISAAILGTKDTVDLSIVQMLKSTDRSILDTTSISDLLAWEKAIAREYQTYSWPEYRKGRSAFLRAQKRAFLDHLADYVEAYRPTIGIYAGSFNPYHLGHDDILKKAEKICDKVILAVGTNPSKPASDLDARVAKLQQVKPYHEVVGFKGLLIDKVKEVAQYANAVLIRGLRDGYDLQFELNQARFQEDLYPGIELVYIPCSREYQHISSSALRGLEQFSPEKAKEYLP